MIKPCRLSIITGLLPVFSLLPTFSSAQDLVRDDLLTASNQTSPWQECVTDREGVVDVTSLTQPQCAYRSTPAAPGINYRMTCGVSVVDYASITLAFLDQNQQIIDKRVTQMTPRQSGVNSVTMTSPSDTAFAAIGIYGETGSGFQDCVLIDNAPPPGPTKGSISGATWFDEDGDSVTDYFEDNISGSPIALYIGDTVHKQTVTDADGTYYFGGLDIDVCYRVKFNAADSGLAYGGPGEDNDADSEGFTPEICLTEEVPNIVSCDSAFLSATPSEPPPDYVACGVSWLDANSNGVFDTGDSPLANVPVTLVNQANGNSVETVTDSNGNYHFTQLLEGSYQAHFQTPDGHDITMGSSVPSENGSYIDNRGRTPVFRLPEDRNSTAASACTIRYVNAGYQELPTVIPPTVAVDDKVTVEVGADFSVNVVGNDAPCDEVSDIDLLGHNVPGDVSYNSRTGNFDVSNTLAAGIYHIGYGLRGSCGSYDTAVVTVELNEPPPLVASDAPVAPVCRIETGGDQELGGVDVFSEEENGFSPQYNLYDKYGKFVISVYSNDSTFREPRTAPLTVPGSTFRGNWEMEWNGFNYGFDQVSIHFISAVENGIESAATRCIRQSVSPIALDIQNKGRIQRLAGNYRVDLNEDGIAEPLNEWFAPSAGILIRNGASGKVSGGDVFGNVPGVYADGYAELASLDANGDNELSANELENLAIWRDLNGDTIIDEGEVSSLDDYDIISLSLTHYKFMSRATKSDGRTILMEDVWLAMTPVAALDH